MKTTASSSKRPATPLPKDNWWVLAVLVTILVLGLLMVGGLVYALLPGW